MKMYDDDENADTTESCLRGGSNGGLVYFTLVLLWSHSLKH